MLFTFLLQFTRLNGTIWRRPALDEISALATMLEFYGTSVVQIINYLTYVMTRNIYCTTFLQIVCSYRIETVQ